MLEPQSHSKPRHKSTKWQGPGDRAQKLRGVNGRDLDVHKKISQDMEHESTGPKVVLQARQKGVSPDMDARAEWPYVALTGHRCWGHNNHGRPGAMCSVLQSKQSQA